MHALRRSRLVYQLLESGKHAYLILAVTLVSQFVAVCATEAAGQQNSPQRDASAISFLAQAIGAAGGASAIGSIQDFTAQGSITHFWADNPELGQLTIKSRGTSQFRLDSQVPEGTWSSVVNLGNGELLLPDGTATPVSYQNTVNGATITWPIFKINAALSDQTMTVIDMGIVPLGGSQARQIQIQQNSLGRFSILTKTNYFFDPVSFLLRQSQDTVHSDEDLLNGGSIRVLDFSNYQNVSGLTVPFTIAQSINSQQIWSVQLSSIAFNTGLSDSDFQF